eukprot:RCo021886
MLAEVPSHCDAADPTAARAMQTLTYGVTKLQAAFRGAAVRRQLSKELKQREWSKAKCKCTPVLDRELNVDPSFIAAITRLQAAVRGAQTRQRLYSSLFHASPSWQATARARLPHSSRWSVCSGLSSATLSAASTPRALHSTQQPEPSGGAPPLSLGNDSSRDPSPSPRPPRKPSLHPHHVITMEALTEPSTPPSSASRVWAAISRSVFSSARTPVMAAAAGSSTTTTATTTTSSSFREEGGAAATSRRPRRALLQSSLQLSEDLSLDRGPSAFFEGDAISPEWATTTTTTSSSSATPAVWEESTSSKMCTDGVVTPGCVPAGGTAPVPSCGPEPQAMEGGTEAVVTLKTLIGESIVDGVPWPCKDLPFSVTPVDSIAVEMSTAPRVPASAGGSVAHDAGEHRAAGGLRVMLEHAGQDFSDGLHEDSPGSEPLHGHVAHLLGTFAEVGPVARLRQLEAVQGLEQLVSQFGSRAAEAVLHSPDFADLLGALFCSDHTSELWQRVFALLSGVLSAVESEDPFSGSCSPAHDEAGRPASRALLKDPLDAISRSLSPGAFSGASSSHSNGLGSEYFSGSCMGVSRGEEESEKGSLCAVVEKGEQCHTRACPVHSQLGDCEACTPVAEAMCQLLLGILEEDADALANPETCKRLPSAILSLHRLLSSVCGTLHQLRLCPHVGRTILQTLNCEAITAFFMTYFPPTSEVPGVWLQIAQAISPYCPEPESGLTGSDVESPVPATPVGSVPAISSRPPSPPASSAPAGPQRLAPSRARTATPCSIRTPSSLLQLSPSPSGNCSSTPPALSVESFLLVS